MNIMMDMSNVLFRILEPNTLAIEIVTPLSPLRASNIIEIFSGISPAKGLRITATATLDTPMTPAKPSSECMKGSAHKKVPTVPTRKKRVAFTAAERVPRFLAISKRLAPFDS